MCKSAILYPISLQDRHYLPQHADTQPNFSALVHNPDALTKAKACDYAYFNMM